MYDRPFFVAASAGIALICILLFSPQAAAAVSWSDEIISDSALDSIYADISGDHVIYSGSIGDAIDENSTRVIQLYSLDTRKERRIATSDPGYTLTGEAIDGNYAVWFSEPVFGSAADGPNQIFLYSINGDTSKTIRRTQTAEWPKISGDGVVWSESPDESIASSIMHYDIRTENTTHIPGISTIDGAGVGFDGDYILYTDAETMDLHLYETGTGTTTTVFERSRVNTTHEIIFGTALGGDYVLYRKDVRTEKPREMYSELCLYTISTGETVLFCPNTGEVTETLTKQDKEATFGSLATDGTHVAWELAEGFAHDRIIVLDPGTMETSSLSPGTFVDFISIDGRHMAWLGSDSIGGNGSIYLATMEMGDAKLTTTKPTHAPGIGLVLTVAGLLIALLISRRYT
ncbi:MAG: hypothetical protein APR55_10145 [Methanolinea sp. SDB]|nr:MAG: hypothetical protein APR55_10145 [Methanolinea sp. SDB]